MCILQVKIGLVGKEKVVSMITSELPSNAHPVNVNQRTNDVIVYISGVSNL